VSDFSLFGKVKGAPIGQEIPDKISLYDARSELLNGISTDDLQRVFRNWIERIENVITAKGGYASWQISSMSFFDVGYSVFWPVK
jgi:hypothetical protein